MRAFTDSEVRLIDRLKRAPDGASIELREACPGHSVCTPLPLFRIRRIDEETFEAEWNTYHQKGPRQKFLFSEAAPSEKV